ncbi:radical SAM/SPASM domain-containing protein [Streptomyces daliensis]|uniref:Radical SAM/SPASM domain-containing protein n=1 Tax=Streptomyces daliensis TaxID=299421 RepID=A0A8T4IHY6_9ACTN|nr:radical SAM/SPASM domain-containing protein [Streptomyces daliensis]
MTATVEEPSAEQRATEFLWLDLTRRCQLECTPCFNSSGPQGTHGTMTREDWIAVIGQAAECGVRRVQFIGGEPTMHPDALSLADRALALGLRVEVYSNLVHISEAWWALLQHKGASLATSYYSNRPDEHNAVTGRPSHARTLANIKKAMRLDIPLRAGIVAAHGSERAEEAKRELAELGVAHISIDRVRPFGRGAQGQAPDPSALCGQCGDGRAAVGPDGGVSPCVFSADWMGVGNVRSTPLPAILGGPELAEARATVRRAVRVQQAWCPPDRCDPGCEPNEECEPGVGRSECDPRN